MHKRVRFIINPEFLEVVAKAQKEANRLCVYVNEVIIMMYLILADTTYISEFFKYLGTPWKNVKNAIRSEYNEYVRKAVRIDPNDREQFQMVGTVIRKNPQEGDSEISLNFGESMMNLVMKALAYSEDGKTFDEVTFILAVLDSEMEGPVSFFKSLHIDSLLVIRYYEGLCFESMRDEMMYQLHELYLSRNGGKSHNDENEEIMDETEYEEYMDDESLEEYDEEVDEEAETITEMAEESIVDAEGKTQENENGVENESQDENKKKLTQDDIPKKLRPIITIVKPDSGSKSPILGRDEETDKLINVLLKKTKSNAVLTGKPGVGKTAIIEHLAWLMANGKCPDEINSKTIISLEVTNLVAGTKYRGMAEERFRLVSEFLADRDDVILFIDEIHTVLGAGSCEGGGVDFANALKPILARDGVSVIGATTNDEYKRIFSIDGAFKRRFERIEIREPKSSEVYPMIKEQVERLSKHHGVAITKPVINFIINVSGCFLFETGNPDRTLDLIDRSMAKARIRGKNYVTNKIVIETFDTNFKAFQEEMSDELKMSTAYHEAGHYIVSKYGKSYSRKVLAVSIVPAEDYLGVTAYDDGPMFIDWDYEDHLQRIASLLAGRVAERLYSGKETSGASSDLECATQEARKIVLEYGLRSSFSKRNSENDLTDERKDRLNKEIDDIISEAYDYAREIIKNHKEALENIAKALFKKGILIGSELDKLCRDKECEKTLIIESEEANS